MQARRVADMVGRMRVLLVMCCALCATAAQAGDGPIRAPLSRDFGCLDAGQWDTGITPPEWARIARACIMEERPDAAIAAFWVYNSYLLYDQQRVRDESAHVIKGELNSWIFAGLSRGQIDALKVWVDRMRGPGDAFHAEVCGALAALGPPGYRPDYMIVRGMIPRKSADDWRSEDFDAGRAWRVATEEENGCGTV